MAMFSVTDILNEWADIGVFAYILPFLMIFAVVFGILDKSKILGKNKGVHVTLALAIGLLALQFDYVSNFFATIFPYAGIGIAVLLVAVILMGLLGDDETKKWLYFGLGAVIFVVILLYTFYDFNWIGGYVGSSDWIPGVIFLAGFVALVIWLIKGGSE